MGWPPNFFWHGILKNRASLKNCLSDHWHLDINVEEKYRHLHLVVSDLPRIGFAMLIQGITILTHLRLACFDNLLAYSPG